VKPDEREIEHVFHRLSRLQTAVIDSSSIIYLDKSGLLRPVAGALRLLTIPQVIDETGMPDLPVTIVDPPALPAGTVTDWLLFATAAARRKAMISEDRAILLKCEAERIEYYNAYNLLVLLRLRRVIEEEEFRLRERMLLEAAHYGKFVTDYVAALLQYMHKIL